MAEPPPPVQSTPAECSSSRHFNDIRIDVPVQNAPASVAGGNYSAMATKKDRGMTA